MAPDRDARILLWIGLAACSALALPAACAYPDYTFNEQEASASATSSSASGSGGNSSSTTTSSGNQGGGGASSSSSSLSSSSGGTGGSPVENCLNNTDDDNDGMVDCADSDCTAGYICVPDTPLGWIGYQLLFAGSPGAAPACPPEFPTSSPFTGINGIFAGPVTCDPCTCAAPTGETCDLPDSVTISNRSCGMNPTVTPRTLMLGANWDGTCLSPSGYSGGDTSCGGLPCHVSASSAAAVVSGGSCMPQGGTPTVPPVTWNTAGKACGNAPPGGGCPGAEVCQPHPPGEPFLTGLCVFKEGDNTCPAGPFTDRHLFYETVMDTRGCTACQCGSPSGSTCDVSITLYSDLSGCTTPVTTFDAGSCGNISGNPNIIGRSASVMSPSGGSCNASGGQPTGNAIAILPTTFCCIP